MKKLFCAVTLLSLSILTGCAHHQATDMLAPKGESFPHSYQLSLQASEHWRNVAAELSRKVKMALVDARQDQRRIFVQSPDGESDFNRAFHEFLVDHLLKEGVRVSIDVKSGLILSYDLQLVRYAKGRKASVSRLESEGQYLATVPNAEVIISSQIVENGMYLLQETGIYYINEQDSKLYEALLRPEPLPTRNLAVKGCKPGSKEC